MKKAKQLIPVVVLAAISTCLCAGLFCVDGSGRVISQQRSVSEFNAVSFSGSGTIHIKQGNAQIVSVSTDDTIMPHLVTEVVGSELRIYTRKCVTRMTALTVTLNMKQIKAIKLVGSAVVESSDKLKGSDITIESSGAGKINLKIEAQNVSTHIAGAGEVTLSGKAATHTVEMSGAGKLNALDLVTRETSLEMSGTGKSKITATDKLDVKLMGAAAVSYRGNPKLTTSIAGACSIEQVP